MDISAFQSAPALEPEKTTGIQPNRKGKPPIDPELRRVQASVRVKRETFEALKAFGEANIGRAIDALVLRARDAGVIAAA